MEASSLATPRRETRGSARASCLGDESGPTSDALKTEVAEPNRAELFDKAENSEWEQLRAEAAGAEQEKLLRNRSTPSLAAAGAKVKDPDLATPKAGANSAKREGHRENSGKPHFANPKASTAELA